MKISKKEILIIIWLFTKFISRVYKTNVKLILVKVQKILDIEDNISLTYDELEIISK